MTAVAFDFVPMGRSTTRDPYPLYDRMREAGRVLTTPYGATLVHRYEDVRQVHLDHDAFSMGAAGGMTSAGGGESMSGSNLMMAKTMLTADPPDHERLRRVVNRAFTPRSITDLEPRAGRSAESCWRRWPPASPSTSSPSSRRHCRRS